MFDARCDHRSLRSEKRNCLTLHVRTHKSTVGIVVFEERDKRGCNRDKLLGVDVHIVRSFLGNFSNILLNTAVDAVAHEFAFFVERFVRLRDDVFVFFVRRHINDLVGYDARRLVDLAVRRFDKSVLVDFCVSRQRCDKTDVLTFRRLDRTHTSVVRVVNVADLETCALSVQAAGAECGKFTFVRKFCNRVGLVHKLRQLRRSEELFDCARYRTNVDERLRRDFRILLCGRHSLFDDSFKA